MKTLIIPAAGKGKRMGEYFFPKCLLAVNQRPILFQIISSWKNFVDEVVIVINEETGPIIKEYVEKYYGDKINIVYCVQKESKGTYFAIKDAIKISKNKEYILNWSDVVLTSSIEDFSLINIKDKNLVFTTEKRSCRWEFIKRNFVNRGPYIVGEGGIYGVFVINKLNDSFLEEKKSKEGELEILEELDSSSFIELKYEFFIDIGDEGKYNLEVRKADEKTRAYGSFNDMKIYKNLVVKKTSNQKMKDGESEWYKNSSFKFIPQIFSYEPLILEKIENSMSVSDRLNLEDKGFEDYVLSKMFSILKEIHESKGKVSSVDESTYEQYIGKTFKRLEKVDFLFSRFNKEEIFINGKKYKNPLILLKEREAEIKKIFPKEFMFIHGDLQTSNALITKRNEVYAIDPRGYFGKTSLYGDPMYDFAKLFYGFCGMWDKFRQGDNKVKISEKGFELVPLLDEKSYERRRKLFFKYAKEVSYTKVEEYKIDLLHAIIWLSVTDYIANDVLSSLYGYLNGTILLNKIFDKI